MKPLFLIATIGFALLGCSTGSVERAEARSVLVRAVAPFAIGEGHGEETFRASDWRVVIGWRSARARTDVAIALLPRESHGT